MNVENYFCWVTKGETCMLVPLFMKSANYQSGGVCLFVQSLSALQGWGLISDYTQEAPRKLPSDKYIKRYLQNKYFKYY